MLVERQVSIFLAGVSTAIAIPEIYPVCMKQAPVMAGPHVGLLIGTALGALGVLLGVILATDEWEHGNSKGQRLFLLGKIVVWALFAFGLSAGTALIALHSPDIGWRIALGVASLGPLAGLMAALVQSGKF